VIRLKTRRGGQLCSREGARAVKVRFAPPQSLGKGILREGAHYRAKKSEPLHED
jgi:hypothetical protein